MYTPELINLLPSNVINKWPAIILAVKRTANDPGRIKFLIVSMHTIKGIKTVGVTMGTRWQNIWLVLLFQNPNKTKVNQRGRANLI